MVTIGPRRQFGVIGHIAATVYPLYPPTIGSTPPVMQLAQLGAAMNAKAGAISSGWAARFMAVPLPNLATCSACLSAGLSGVQTGPGATALTRMPLSTRGAASERVKA
jgi:hypothetical protein